MFGGVAHVGLRLADFPQSLPDLSLNLFDHFLGKVSAMGHTTRLTQPSIPLGSVNEYSNPFSYMDYGNGDH